MYYYGPDLLFRLVGICLTDFACADEKVVCQPKQTRTPKMITSKLEVDPPEYRQEKKKFKARKSNEPNLSYLPKTHFMAQFWA